MKKGEITCEKMSCSLCPYKYQDEYLRICTSFKLKEELFNGLKYAKKHFPKKVAERLERTLNQEYIGVVDNDK